MANDTTTVSKGLLPDPRVAKRYDVTPRTINRWDKQPELGFPAPVVINRRKYRHLEQLEDWERRRVARTIREERA